MTTLLDACKLVLSKHPDQKIHVVNEYKDVYQFMTINKNEVVGPYTFFGDTPYVIKQTGELIEEASITDSVFDGDFNQHFASEIKGI